MLTLSKSLSVLLLIFSLPILFSAQAYSQGGGTSTTIAGIRAFSGTKVVGQYYYVTDPGKQGFFYYDTLDVSTPDNTGTVLVDLSGKRYKRLYFGLAHLAWFSAPKDSSIDQSAIVLTAIKACANVRPGLFIDSGVYYVKGLVDSGYDFLHIEGPGILKSHYTSAFGTNLLRVKNCKNIDLSQAHFDGNFPTVAGSPTGGIILLRFEFDSAIIVKNSSFSNNGYLGVALFHCYNANFSYNVFDTTDCSIITFGGCNVVTADHNKIIGGTSEGIVFWGLSGAVPVWDYNCSATNNYVFNKPGGFEQRFVDGFLIDGNISVSCFNGVYGTNVNTGPGDHNSLTNNPRNGTITNNIDSNTLSNPIGGPYTDVLIANNHTWYSRGYGIRMGTSNDSSFRVKITGNTFREWSILNPGLNGEAIRCTNCFNSQITDNDMSSDVANSCMTIVTSDSIIVRNNKMKSTATFQWVAQNTTHLLANNNTGNLHGPFPNLNVFLSSNNNFSDTTFITTDTVNNKPLVYNPVTGYIHWFQNWNGIAGQNTIRYSHTIFTPTTGGTVAIANNQYNIINPAGTIAALTVSLPTPPANNDVVYIKFAKAVSSVTYTNGTVIDGMFSPAAGSLLVLTYDAATASWY